MLCAQQPTDEEHQELQRMVSQEVESVSRRDQIVLASVRRNLVPDIATVFQPRHGPSLAGLVQLV